MSKHIIERGLELGVRPIEHLFQIAGLASYGWKDANNPILYFIPSRIWRLVVEDVRKEAEHTWQKKHMPWESPPANLVPPRMEALNIMTMRFVDAKTDDQDICDWLNEPEARRCHFGAVKEMLISHAPRLGTFKPELPDIISDPSPRLSTEDAER